MPTNMVLIGAAYQAGCLPLSADALEQAIRLNGAAVEKNLAAFALGPRGRGGAGGRARRCSSASRSRRPRRCRGEALRDRRGDRARRGELRRLLRGPRRRADRPTRARRYARRYVDDVVAVARAERERGAPGETAIAEAYARGLFKLMAYKDEYEVARLHLDAVEQARRAGRVRRGRQGVRACSTRRCCGRWG